DGCRHMACAGQPVAASDLRLSSVVHSDDHAILSAPAGIPAPRGTAQAIRDSPAGTCGCPHRLAARGSSSCLCRLVVAVVSSSRRYRVLGSAMGMVNGAPVQVVPVLLLLLHARCGLRVWARA